MTLREAVEALPDAAFSMDGVTVRPIRTEDDLIYATVDFKLKPEQEALVNPAGFSIGRAYLHPEDNVPCLICNESGRPVGFVCLCRWLAAGDAYSWSYFIDRSQQGRGYGRKAAKLAVRILKAAAPHKELRLAVEPHNRKAQELYASIGFEKTDMLDGDELVFRYSQRNQGLSQHSR